MVLKNINVVMLPFNVLVHMSNCEDLILQYHKCPAGVPEEHPPVQGTGHLLEAPGLVDEVPHLDQSFWLHPAAQGTLAGRGRGEEAIKPNIQFIFIKEYKLKFSLKKLIVIFSLL